MPKESITNQENANWENIESRPYRKKCTDGLSRVGENKEAKGEYSTIKDRW